MDAQNLHHETQQADGELETDDEIDAQTPHHEIHYASDEIEIPDSRLSMRLRLTMRWTS